MGRVLDAVPTILLILTLVFVALRLLPGDPARVALGDYATQEQLALFRQQMGLDLPLWQQYFVFLWDMVRFDFGRSLTSQTLVSELIGRNLPYTIELTLSAVALGVLAGIPMGVLAAVKRRKLADSGCGYFLWSAMPFRISISERCC